MSKWQIEEITGVYPSTPYTGTVSGSLAAAKTLASKKQRYVGTWLSVTNLETGEVHVKKKDKWKLTGGRYD